MNGEYVQIVLLFSNSSWIFRESFDATYNLTTKYDISKSYIQTVHTYNMDVYQTIIASGKFQNYLFENRGNELVFVVLRKNYIPPFAFIYNHLFLKFVPIL